MEMADHQRSGRIGIPLWVVTEKLIHAISSPWSTPVLMLCSQGDERGVGGSDPRCVCVRLVGLVAH